MLTTLGAVATVAPAGSADGLGLGCVALACVAWALDNNFTREVPHLDAVTIAAAKGLVGGGVNLAAAWALGSGLPAPGAAALVSLVGAVFYGLSLVLYDLGPRRLGAARVAAYFAIAPFVGAAADPLALGEPMTPALSIAALLSAIGVWRLFGDAHSHGHRHGALEHCHVHLHDAAHRHGHETLIGSAAVRASTHCIEQRRSLSSTRET